MLLEMLLAHHECLCLPSVLIQKWWNQMFFQHNFCVKLYVPGEPRRDPSDRRLNKHGIWCIFVRNSQPVMSQVRADPTRPQAWTCLSLRERVKQKLLLFQLQPLTRSNHKKSLIEKNKKKIKISSNLYVGFQNFLTTIRNIMKYQTKMQQQGNKNCQRKLNNRKKGLSTKKELPGKKEPSQKKGMPEKKKLSKRNELSAEKELLKNKELPAKKELSKKKEPPERKKLSKKKEPPEKKKNI